MRHLPLIIIIVVAVAGGAVVWLWPWDDGVAVAAAPDDAAFTSEMPENENLSRALVDLVAAYQRWQRGGMLDAFGLETAVEFDERRRMAREFGAANEVARRRLVELNADPDLIRIRELDEQFVQAALELLDHLEETLGTWSYNSYNRQVQFERVEDIEVYNGILIRLGEIQQRQFLLMQKYQNADVP